MANTIKGKPGDPSASATGRAYHLRLRMWLSRWAATERLVLQSARRNPTRLRHLGGIQRHVDLPDGTSRMTYKYTFTTPDERRQTGRWWNRELIGTFYGPVALQR